MTINYHSAPNNFGDTWKRYYESGCEPGSFGTALLCNDLTMACLSADNVNRRLIYEHFEWLWNNLPREGWGSPDRVTHFLSEKRKN